MLGLRTFPQKGLDAYFYYLVVRLIHKALFYTAVKSITATIIDLLKLTIDILWH